MKFILSKKELLSLSKRLLLSVLLISIINFSVQFYVHYKNIMTDPDGKIYATNLSEDFYLKHLNNEELDIATKQTEVNYPPLSL